MGPHRNNYRIAAILCGATIGLSYKLWSGYVAACQWQFIAFLCGMALIFWLANRPVASTAAPGTNVSGMRSSVIVTLLLLLAIALFPVGQRPIPVPWGWSRWIFIAYVDRIDWGIMALESVIAVVIGGLVWARKA